MWTQYWPIYERLEKEICDFTFQVALSDNQLTVHSIKLAEYVLRICSECENCAAELAPEPPKEVSEPPAATAPTQPEGSPDGPATSSTTGPSGPSGIGGPEQILSFNSQMTLPRPSESCIPPTDRKSVV